MSQPQQTIIDSTPTWQNQYIGATFITNNEYLMSETKNNREGSVITRDKAEIREPSLYKVLLHNDDYSSMEFVVSILENVFRKSTPEATKIMLDVHQQGIGIAGVYTREICETKISLVHGLARKNDFPLRCSMEPL